MNDKKPLHNNNLISIIGIVVVILLSMATSLATSSARMADMDSRISVNTFDISDNDAEINVCDDNNQDIQIILAEMRVDIKYIKESVKKLEAK